MLLVGCSDGSDEVPATPTVRPTSTPSLSRLTDARQERLADTVSTLSRKHGWAAGCVFRYNADETIFDEFERPAGTAGYSFVTDREVAPAVVLFVEGLVTVSGSYREYIPDNGVSFCYVPE